MMTSLLTSLYEDLLIGEQVDVPTTVYEGLFIGEQVDVLTTVDEGLLIGEQADVYTCRSFISCGTNSLNGPALRAVLMFWLEYQALQQLLKEEESNKADEEGGKGGREDKREIS